MVIIHIANIDTTIIGGVQIAVPQMIIAQSQYADVGFINTHGDVISDVQMLECSDRLAIDQFPAPFNKPDIVIFHEVYRLEYIKFYRYFCKSSIPYIIIPHGCLSKSAQKKKWLKKTIANAILFDNFIKNACSIQYLSDNEKNMSAFFNDISFVSYNGVSLPSEKKSVFFKNGIKFVYIGRLEMHIKGLDLLLQAVKKCENLMRESHAKLELFGPDYNGSHKRIVQIIDKLNIADLVKLDKEKMGEEKKTILLSSDCFIQTSRTEGLPLGPLEALGYGLPCIVTDGVGLGNSIERFGAGYRCVTSVEGIADVIEQFIKSIDKIEIMSQSAAKLIEEEFNINLNAKRTVDKYYEILNE